jgi:hypothetical protein
MEIFNDLENREFDNNQIDYLLSISNDFNSRIAVEHIGATYTRENINDLPF